MTRVNDKSKNMIFLGYKDISIYNPNEGKIMIGRDVELDVEREWGLKVNDDDKYIVLQIFDKKREI